MRRRNILVANELSAAFPDMEYMLLRCPKFYAKENLETVFPDAGRVIEKAKQNHMGDAHYYLLYTFQPSDYVLLKPGEVGDAALLLDSDSQDISSDDDGAVSTGPSSPAGKANDDDFSELIQYTPASVEWKDRSRERFFEFMKAARTRIAERLAAASATTSTEKETAALALFMDWPDPATGLPVRSKRGPSTFNDADTIQQFFSYNSVLIAGPGGGCRMIEHPRFGLNVYPAAGVIVVPKNEEETLCEAVHSLSQ